MDEKASVTLATGAEARLISAEAALQRGASDTMLILLNALRASPPTYFLNAGATIPAMTALAAPVGSTAAVDLRSEEHTSELQSQSNLVCRLLLEKKKQ